MKKKVLLIVLPIILAIAIATTVIVIVLLNKNKEDESVGTKWGDTYYAYLKEAVNEDDLTDAEEKYGMMLGMKNAKIQFCEVDEGQDPTMIMTYEKENNSYVNVYQITDKKKVNYIAYKQPTEVEYLYNIEKDEYSWYIHVMGTDSDSYSSLKDISDTLKDSSKQSEGNENINIAEIEADYTIKKDEATTTQETVDGDTITLDKFDEIFVRPEIESNEQIDFDVDMTDKDLKKSLKKVVENYEKETKKITDAIQEQVSKKVEEIKTKKGKIEQIKKSEEEAKNGIKIGKYTIKYGKYEAYVDTYKTGEIIVLNQDGTCQVTANWAADGYSTRTFTYKTGRYNFSQDITPSYEDGIAFFNSDGTTACSYIATNENTLADNDITIYKYAGEAESTPSTTEDTSNSLKVGKYSLKYGKYTGDDFSDGTDRAPYKGTYTIKSDGTYTFSSTSGKSSSGTYYGAEMGALPGYNDVTYGIIFTSNSGEKTTLFIMKNNSFQYMAGAGSVYNYQGE